MTKKFSMILCLPVFTILTFCLLNYSMVKRLESIDLPKLDKPSLVIRKKARKLEVFDKGKLIKSYTIVLGFTSEGDKKTEGDGKTPEGDFYIFTKNANSRFFLSLGVSYPSIDDARRGLEQKLISQEDHDAIVKAINTKQMPLQKTRLGGEIYIHGGGTDSDWTEGCVALKNEEIQELFEAIPVGTTIRIEP